MLLEREQQSTSGTWQQPIRVSHHTSRTKTNSMRQQSTSAQTPAQTHSPTHLLKMRVLGSCRRKKVFVVVALTLLHVQAGYMMTAWIIHDKMIPTEALSIDSSNQPIMETQKHAYSPPIGSQFASRNFYPERGVRTHLKCCGNIQSMREIKIIIARLTTSVPIQHHKSTATNT